ncbi:hypothetical protein BJF79_45550 [Actinomadura sp. CNU-125]|nr:hypothetical protein BJF79_45550 [Actinomadura sp. CNU-125]
MPGPDGRNDATCGETSPASAPSQAVMTCAFGCASASASVSAPSATMIAAQESSSVSRREVVSPPGSAAFSGRAAPSPVSPVFPASPVSPAAIQ